MSDDLFDPEKQSVFEGAEVGIRISHNCDVDLAISRTGDVAGSLGAGSPGFRLQILDPNGFNLKVSGRPLPPNGIIVELERDAGDAWWPTMERPKIVIRTRQGVISATLSVAHRVVTARLSPKRRIRP